MKAELFTDLDRITAIEDEWRALAEAQGSAFTSPEWARSWWASGAGEGTEPLIAVARDGDRMAGVLPLARDRAGGAVRFAAAALGDHFGPVAAASETGEVAAAAMTALEDAGETPRMTILHRVDADSEWPQRMADGSRRRQALIVQSRADLLYIPTAGLDWDGYLATRSQKFRQRVARGLEKALSKEHSYEVRESTEDSLRADLEILFRLHDLRHAETSSIAAERDRAFLAEFSQRAMGRGWLRLRTLEIEGEPVASFLCWSVGGRIAIYQSGFDPAWARFSVGALLLVDTVRSAIEAGVDEVDLLLGEEPYKQRFAAATRTVHTVTLAPRWSRARFMVSAEAAARRRARGLAAHPRVGRALKRAARLLPTGRR